MRVRDVLTRPELRLTLLAGGALLDRPVSRVYITDLLDPSRYLSGEELVLTGLMWRRVPEDSEAFVAALAAAGVSALGAGDAALGSVPPDLVRACERHGVPLFEVPVEISFEAITDQVSPGLWAERASGLAAVLGRQRGLFDALAGGARLDDLLTAALSTTPGAACWVLSVTGRLVGGTGSLPPEQATELVRGFLSAPALPATVRAGGREYTVAGTRARPGVRLADWMIVYRPGVESGQTGAGFEELRSIVALVRARHEDGLRVERRLAGELAAVLIGRAEPAELRARLRSCALPVDGSYQIVVADPVGLAAEPALDLTEEILRTASAASAVGADPLSGRLIGVVAVPAAGVLPRIRGAVARSAVGLVADGLDTARLPLGVSEPVDGVSGLCGALTEAVYACRFAAERPGPANVVCTDELASHSALLSSVAPEVRRAFRRRLLGALVEYDQRHDADLVHTLTTFLDCSGSWIKCAGLLHVHVNTLRYRIRRIEQLTGRDLARFADRVDLFLALQIPDG